jgi:hypothetical protein
MSRAMRQTFEDAEVPIHPGFWPERTPLVGATPLLPALEEDPSEGADRVPAPEAEPRA